MEEPLRRVAAHLAAEEQVLLGYLFGSRATGQAHPASDYDIAVLVEEPSVALYARLQHELGRLLHPHRVDLVFLNWVPIELAYNVIAHGQLLYERDIATRVDYEAKVLNLYMDYLPFLRRQREAIMRGHTDDEAHRRQVQRHREALERTERTLAEIRAPRPASHR